MNESQVFANVLKRSTPAERAAYLDEACAGNPEQRDAVDALLRAHATDPDFLEQPAVSLGATVDVPTAASAPAEGPSGCAAPARPGVVLAGRFKLLQPLGEGGMGAVWMAEQMQPVRRKVALKLIKSGMDSAQVLARFDAERQALALMDHPNIARVFDAGTTDAARPYFVMELVKGVPITKYCDEGRLTPRQRLELFVSVCQAVQHAHHKGVIHRDLKPSNVMVCLYDGKPVPKVIDFGIAKATGPGLTEKTLFTEVGQVVGTLEYMSPEQAELNQLDIDTRSDIYSLGVLLYELLTGTTPLERKRLRTVALLEVLRLIREEETPPPSTRLSTVEGLPAIAANRGVEPAKLSGLLRGELDWILMKALEKDRNRRYETASAFAADVQRHLRDEPVLACPPSAWYRLAKFARRHKAALRITAAAAMVLLFVAAGSAWTLWDQATRQAELSQRTAETERTVNDALAAMQRWRDQAGTMPRRTSEEADAVLVVWQQAEAALAPALAALKTGTANDLLRQQVLHAQQESEQQCMQGQRKAKLLRDLDDARLRRSLWREKQFDFAGAAAQYATAFAAYDLDVKPGRTEELARRIRAEEAGVRDALIVALDDWSDNAVWAKKGLLAKELRAIAGAVDDNAWRQKYRAAASARDGVALRSLSREARQLSLPPSSLVLLAWSLRSQGERAEMLALLRWARVRHSGDFWVHYVLGRLLDASGGQSGLELEEAIGCYTTALALRPRAVAVYNNLGIHLFAKNQAEAREAAIYAFRQALKIDPGFAMAHYNLGNSLKAKNELDEAIVEYRKAVELDPQFAEARHNFGLALKARNRWDEAIAQYRKAIELNPKLATAYYNLAVALRAKNRLDEAITQYRMAIKLDPNYAPAHCNLGYALRAKNHLDEAITEFRKAIDLDPKCAPAHYGLANELAARNQLDEAAAEYRKAIDIDPSYAPAHYNLARILTSTNQLDEAVAEYRKAIDFDPKWALAHFNLGCLLQGRNQLDEAAAEYRKAIDIDPKDAGPYINLGNTLTANKQLDEAVAAFRQAIDVAPKEAWAHYGLGNALRIKNKLTEAAAAFRKAIDLQPDNAAAHCNLANILCLQGQLSSSLEFYKRGHALASKRKDWHYPSAQWVADAERLVRLEAKLSDVLAGKATPTDNRERLGLVKVCRLLRRHVAAVRLYIDAFTADAKLADDLKSCHRYTAACCAVLAAAGQGTDADKRDQEQSRLRQQALAWLRADLVQWSKRREGGKPADRQVVRATLEHWQRDTDLIGVRDADALKKLLAGEQKAWRKLWADVAELLKKADNAK